MKIILNGQSHDTGSARTILDLLAAIGLAGRPVVVEINKRALLPREHGSTALSEGDVVEVVQITAGG